MVKQSVLVVEDEEDIRELVSYNLLKEGYQVAGVASGEDALAAVALETARPGPLGPHAAGLGRAERLPQAEGQPADRAIPVVMLTAKGEEADIVPG